MTNPNRSQDGSPSRNPSPDEIRSARESAGFTQAAASQLLHTTPRVWQQWEAGDRRMHPAFWDAFHAALKKEKS